MEENEGNPRFFVVRVMLRPDHFIDFDERRFVKTVAAYYVCDNSGNVEYACNDIDYVDSATDDVKDAVERIFSTPVFEVDDNVESLVLRSGLRWVDINLGDNVDETMESAVEYINCNSPYGYFMRDKIDERYCFNK
jgi:hypothetical protein